MKTFCKNTNSAAQGEILFLRTDKIPEGLQTAKPENGHLIIGHSETGHHHVIDLKKSKQAQLLIDKTNALIAYLDIGEDSIVEHLRSYDTHESIKLPAGKYQIRYRAEDTPQGWQRVMD